MLYPVMAADDLTQRKPAKWVVRTGWTSSQPNHPFGEYVAKTLGYKRVVTIAIDYAFGWEQVGGFQKTFEENGGQVIQKLWAPLNTTDFAPYLSPDPPRRRRRLRADGVDLGAALPQAVPGRRAQGEAAADRRRHHVRRVRAARRSATRPSAASAPLIYSAALDTPDQQAVRGGVPQEVRQGAVVLLGDLLHDAGAGSTRRPRRSAATSRTARSSSRRCARSRSRTRRAARSSSTPTATRSRTSTSARSRRRTASCGTP